jgi:hypothetical protein
VLRVFFGQGVFVFLSCIDLSIGDSYHIEAFYRFQVNDNISITPGVWILVNPENDSRNDTQWFG